MKRTELDNALNLVEAYYKTKINRHKTGANRNPGMMLAYSNSLEALQLARNGDIGKLKLLLDGQR